MAKLGSLNVKYHKKMAAKILSGMGALYVPFRSKLIKKKMIENKINTGDASSNENITFEDRLIIENRKMNEYINTKPVAVVVAIAFKMLSKVPLITACTIEPT